MSGYVEAGYAVVGVSLAAYSTWILGRSRSIARAVRPLRDDEAEEKERREPAPEAGPGAQWR
jgi:hypothetical protein